MMVKNNWIIAGILMLLLSAAAYSAVELFKYNERPANIFKDPLVVKLAESAMQGDEQAVSELIKNGVDINFQGKGGKTPLLWALQEQNQKGFSLLLKLGANPNLAIDSGGSVMTFAAMEDSPFYLKAALEHGGDANYFHAKRKENVIFIAISPGKLEFVKLLLKHGADINAKSGTEDTPLITAGSLNQFDIAYYLLEQGADFNLANRWGKTIKDRIERNNIVEGSELYKWRAKVIEFLAQKGITVNPRVK